MKLKPLKPSVVLFDYQSKTADAIVSGFKDSNAVLLADPVGYGKTYIICLAIRKLFEQGFFDERLWPVVWVTKARVVKQTQAVIKETGLDNIITLVTNYDKLRSTFGSLFIEQKTVVKYGFETTIYNWSPSIIPRLIVLDECQSLRLADSTQTKIIQSLIDMQDHPMFEKEAIGKCSFIFSSATPFMRLSEAWAFLSATKKRIPCFGTLNSETMLGFFHQVVRVADPEEYNASAMDRLNDLFKDCIIRSKFNDVQHSFSLLKRKLHKSRFSAIYLDTYGPTLSKYQDRLNDLQQKLSRLGDDDKFSRMLLTQDFVRSVEPMRAPFIADLMLKVYDKGKLPFAAVNYKSTVMEIYKHLTLLGLPPHKIGLLWGGPSAEDKDNELVKTLQLTSQSANAMQSVVERIQSDEVCAVIYTFKAGGVGLSLHQAKPDMRPRHLFVSPTYSAIEFVQACGRVPRITSWSDTDIQMVVFKNTHEVKIVDKITKKLSCLRRVVMSNESWYDIVDGTNTVYNEKNDLTEELEGVYIGEIEAAEEKQ